MTGGAAIPTEDAKRKGAWRLTQIDGLRALAALMVVAFHYTTRFDSLFLHAEALAFQVPHGYLGVQLFFAISGFVIYMTLDRVRTPAEFVVARFSRLFPTYWVAVIFTWLLVAASPFSEHGVSWKAGLFNLTMLQAFFSVPDVDGVYWSLQVELVFYTWMLALWVSGGLRRPVLVCAAWVALASVANLAERFGIRVPYTLRYFLLLDWIPWFALGMIAYISLNLGEVRRTHLLVGLLAIAAIAIRGPAFMAAFGVFTGSMVFLASRGRLPFLAWKPVVFVGLVSYPLYLVHEKIGWLVISAAEDLRVPVVLAIVLALGCSMIVAALLHYTVEMPASKAIRAAYKRRAARGPFTGFSRWRWTASAMLAVFILASSSMVTARLRGAVVQGRSAGVELNATKGVPCAIGNSAEPVRVVIVLGQSNAASHAQRSTQTESARLLASGTCVVAGDPLPGTTGNGASIWTALAPHLRDQPQGGDVIFAPLAVGDTRIRQWIERGPLRDRLDALLSTVARSGFRPVAVLWQQGEADGLALTPAAEFRDDLLAIRLILDRAGITAPLLVAKSTYCSGKTSSAIRRAVDASLGGRVQAGPDTDRLGSEYRYDGCHFNEAGRQAAAQLWSKELLPVLRGPLADAPATGS